MLSMIATLVTVLADKPPPQPPIAQRFSALAQRDRYCAATECPLLGVKLTCLGHPYPVN